MSGVILDCHKWRQGHCRYLVGTGQGMLLNIPYDIQENYLAQQVNGVEAENL